MIQTQNKDNIRHWIQNNRESILQLVTKLVEFQTVNLVITGTESDCQQFVADTLSGMELDVRHFSPEDVAGFHDHPAYYPGKDYSDRPNVVGRWKGNGSGKSLLFSSHVDTAVVAPGWANDPWTTRIEGDRMFGLGTFDMKGGLAASIMAIQCLQSLGLQPAGDVIIESVVDEEFGGANGTLACRVLGIEADAAIIPEPTNMMICPATRGGALWRLTFEGTSGLSFSGEVIINPTLNAAKFIAFLEHYEKQRNLKPGPAPWYSEAHELPVVVTRVEAGDRNAILCDSGPAVCHVEIWVECYPGTTEEELMEDISVQYQAYYGDVDALPAFEKLIRFLPGAEVGTDSPLLQTLGAVLEQVDGHPAIVQGALFACDAFMFNLYSPTPAIVIGPVGANAHAPEEYIVISRFLDLVEVYAQTILTWCGNDSNEGGNKQ